MNNLSQFKKLQEVKQSALAKEIGISEAYLSLIINGFRELTPKTADKIANALKLTEKEKKQLALLALPNEKIKRMKKILSDPNKWTAESALFFIEK